jgi:hypothetical protein
MIYRGAGFLAVRRFGYSPTPSPLSRQQLVFLSQSSCVLPVELTEGRRGGGEPNLNHSILSGLDHPAGHIVTTQNMRWTLVIPEFLYLPGCNGFEGGEASLADQLTPDAAILKQFHMSSLLLTRRNF